MASLRGRNTTAVALYVDGYDVKLAKMSLRKGRVVLEDLRSAKLVTKLEERQPSEALAEAMSPTEGEFGAPVSEGLPEVSAAEDNNAVLLELLTPYSTAQYALAYSIAEPSLYYNAVEGGAGLKGKKLKDRIIQELQSSRSTSPPPDAVDHFSTAEGGLMAVVREDGLGLYTAIEGIKPFLGKRLPLFSLIDSSDTALIGLARANYGFAAEEISVIVYVGVEFTRLFFMKGTEFYHFAPVLGEGYEAPNIQNTIYSRLLLEQDSLGIARVDRIFIAGEGIRIGFDEFLREQLPEVDIQYLKAPYLDVSLLPAELQDRIPEYAVPIATAWKVLQETHPAFYPINLIPEVIREGQRVFKLAWHGFLLLGLIFVSTFFFTGRITSLNSRITSRQAEFVRKEAQAKVNDSLRAQITDLNRRLEGFKTALTVYETIVPGYDRWSGVLRTISSGFAEINSVWITELNGKEDGTLSIRGFTLYRTRVPRVANIFEKTVLRTVEVEEIRGKTVYKFHMTIELPKPTQLTKETKK